MQIQPNFLIVGAAKAGTTSLYYWLSQHPEIFLSPIKEPCFFSFANRKPVFPVCEDIITEQREYERLFSQAGHFPLRGEASTLYLYLYEESIANIKRYLVYWADLKIIIVLRNPVDRAFSQYMMNVRDLREDLSFEDAIDAEWKRQKESYHPDFFYVDRGFYYEQVKAYLSSFEATEVYLLEDLKADSQGVVRDLCAFLGVAPDSPIRTQTSFNFSGRPRWAWVNRVIKSNTLPKRALKLMLTRRHRNQLFEWIKNTVYKRNLRREELVAETRYRLAKIYEEDINKLSHLLRRDLSHWT